MDLKIYSLEKETHDCDSTADKVSRRSPKLSLNSISDTQLLEFFRMLETVKMNSVSVDTTST
jgi:hypothetical protein